MRLSSMVKLKLIRQVIAVACTWMRELEKREKRPKEERRREGIASRLLLLLVLLSKSETGHFI